MNAKSDITPIVSVVIASYMPGTDIDRCLRSLLDQQTNIPFDITVVESSANSTAARIAHAFPTVKVIAKDRRCFCGEARNIAIQQSRGDIIAFIDCDCTVPHDWVERVIAAHHNPAPAIGGAIANGTPDSITGTGAYLCEFSAWLPGQPAGVMRDIAGASMTYKRRIFREHGSFIEGTYCSDTEFHWRLRRAGTPIIFDPDIRITHFSITSFRRYVRHEFYHGRSFGLVRRRYGKLSATRRATLLLFAPLVPLKLFVQVVHRASRNPASCRALLLSWPFVLAGILSWCAGETYSMLQPAKLQTENRTP